MSPGRFLAVLGLDLSHNLRRPLFWILLLIVSLMVWGLSGGAVTISSGDSSVGGTRAWVTSEFANAQLFSLVTLLIYGFFVSVSAGMSVIQDHEQKVTEVLHATPLRPSEYIWGKFLAVLLSFVGVLAVHILLAAFFNHVLPNAASKEVHGPFVLENYVLPALLFALPTMILIAGSSFAIGAWTRRPILVFVLPVALLLLCGFFLWEWSPVWLSPQWNRVLQAVDPSGFRWINETWLKVDRGVDFYNHKHVGLDMLFVINRLACVVLGFGLVALSGRSYARASRGHEGRAAATSAAAAPPILVRAEARPARPLAAMGMTVSRQGFLGSLIHVARVELKELFSQPGLYIFVPMILLQTLTTALIATGPFDTPLLMTPGTMAERSLGPLTTMLCLLLLFYTVEALERERSTGLAPIFGATPLSTSALLGGKVVASALIGIAVAFATLIGFLIASLIQGRVPFDLGPFMLLWGLGLTPTLLFWGAFLMATLALTGNRYTTYAVGLAVLAGSAYFQFSGKLAWAANWALWRTIRWSDISFMELDRTAFILNRLEVLGAAVLLTAFAVRIWPRRDVDAITASERMSAGNLLRGTFSLSPFLLVPAGCAIALAFMVHGGFQGGTQKKLEKDYWRKNLNTWKDAPVPSLQRTDIKLDLDPNGHRLKVEGSFGLIQGHAAPMEAFCATGGAHWRHVQWTWRGKKFEPEDRKGLYVFRFAQPLVQGDTGTLGFRFDGEFPGAPTKNGGGTEEFILPSAVVLTAFSPSFVPVLGFVDGVGIDKTNRTDAKVYSDTFYTSLVEPAWGYGLPFKTHIEVSGPSDFLYNSVGTLTRNEVNGARRTEVWDSEEPVVLFNVVAGKWDVKRAPGVAIYYHHGHQYNVDEMLEALGAARKYYSQWFAPFPWKELKLSEFPNLASYAQGFPTNIPFSEGIGFLAKSDPRANVAFMVTAHESAHQWWGNILVPGKGPGGDILSEGMAHFSTALLFEQVKGPHQRIEFLKQIEKRYNENRHVNSEQPLYKTDGSRSGDVTVTYDKGGWVTWMLLNLMGRDRCLAGIQAFISKYHSNPDHPLLQDFTATLRDFAPDKGRFDAFVQQWYGEVELPEFKLSGEKCAASPGGGYDVSVQVENAGDARIPVQVAATVGERFPDSEEKAPARGKTPKKPAVAYQDVRGSVELAAGEKRTLTIHCAFKPAQLIVDPDALVLQRGRKQAVAKV